MIKCNLQSVEVNITLEMANILLHGIYTTLFNMWEIKRGQEYTEFQHLS